MSLSTPQQPKTAQKFDDFGGRGMTQQPGTAGVSNSHGQSPLPFEPGGPRKRRGHDGHTIGSWKSTSIMSENGDLIGFNGIHEYIYIYEKKIYIYICRIHKNCSWPFDWPWCSHDTLALQGAWGVREVGAQVERVPRTVPAEGGRENGNGKPRNWVCWRNHGLHLKIR